MTIRTKANLISWVAFLLILNHMDGVQLKQRKKGREEVRIARPQKNLKINHG